MMLKTFSFFNLYARRINLNIIRCLANKRVFQTTTLRIDSNQNLDLTIPKYGLFQQTRFKKSTTNKKVKPI